MRLIKRRIRSLFALQAVILLFAVVNSALHPRHMVHAVSPGQRWMASLGFTLLAAVFATAWWTTRKPSQFRNVWAMVASVLSLGEGVVLLWFAHSSLAMVSPSLIAIALGGFGLHFFSKGGAPSASIEPLPQVVVAKPRPTPVSGDRTSRWGNHIFSTLSFVAQFGSIYLWSGWARVHGHASSGRMPWYLLFTVAVLVSTVLHELGHALVAWGCGMKLLSFTAGPLRWRKLEGHWKFKFDAEGFFNLGGAVRVVPTNPKQPIDHDFWMIAAGPLVNIFTGFAALWAVLFVTWPFYAQTWRLVAFTASFSFIAALTNLLPFRIEDGGYSDGARIVQILTKSPVNDYFRAMNETASLLVTSRRPRDLNIRAIERAAASFPRDLQGLLLRLFAVHFYQDSGQIPKARTALAHAERMYNDFSIDLPLQLHTIFVIDHALLNRNAALSRLWWKRMETKGESPLNVDYFLARAAVSWIEGRRQEAEDAWHKASIEARKLPRFGAYEFDRSLCELLRKQLDQMPLDPMPLDPMPLDLTQRVQTQLEQVPLDQTLPEQMPPAPKAPLFQNTFAEIHAKIAAPAHAAIAPVQAAIVPVQAAIVPAHAAIAPVMTPTVATRDVTVPAAAPAPSPAFLTPPAAAVARTRVPPPPAPAPPTVYVPAAASFAPPRVPPPPAIESAERLARSPEEKRRWDPVEILRRELAMQEVRS